MPSPAGFVRAKVDGRDVAIGMIVAAGKGTGVFGMTTGRRFRRRGLVLAVLVSGALGGGRRCARLYLRVEQDDIAARNLCTVAGSAIRTATTIEVTAPATADIALRELPLPHSGRYDCT